MASYSLTPRRWPEVLVTLLIWSFGLMAAFEYLKAHHAPPPPQTAAGMLTPPLSGLGSSLQPRGTCAHCGHPHPPTRQEKLSHE